MRALQATSARKPNMRRSSFAGTSARRHYSPFVFSASVGVSSFAAHSHHGYAAFGQSLAVFWQPGASGRSRINQHAEVDCLDVFAEAGHATLAD